MRYETVTVQECLNMYHIKGKRTILHNGKVLGFQKEKADKLGKDFERRTAARIVPHVCSGLFSMNQNQS